MTEHAYADAVAAAVRLAREGFEAVATHGGEVDLETTDGMQIALMRWQRDRFGDQSGHDLKMALGIVEEMGETFEANTAEEALDGLGDTCVYAGQLLIANRLMLAPVLDLARVLSAAGGDVVPLLATGKLAHTVLKGSQGIRGMNTPDVYRAKLVEHVAMCIAKTIDDCEIAHSITVKVGHVYRVVGAEVMQRKKGDPMIPGFDPTATNADKCIVSMPPRHMMSSSLDLAMALARGTDVAIVHERFYTPPSAEDVDAAKRNLARAADDLAEAERVEGPGDFTIGELHGKVTPRDADFPDKT